MIEVADSVRSQQIRAPFNIKLLRSMQIVYNEYQSLRWVIDKLVKLRETSPPKNE